MYNNQLQLVTYEQAKKLKELGFRWKCYHFYYLNGNLSKSLTYDDSNDPAYDDSLSAPTVALALMWFRGVKKYACDVVHGFENDVLYCYGRIVNPDFISRNYENYESAESALLDKLIKIEEKKS